MSGDSIIVPVPSMVPEKKGFGTSALLSKGEKQTLGFLCFCLGKEEFAVDLNLIKQIVQLPPITDVPRTRSYFIGVISVRGGAVSLVDLRQLIGLDPAEITKLSRVLLFDAKEEQVGLLVDRVTLVRRVPVGEFEMNPVLDENPVTEKVVGIIRPEEGIQVTVIELRDIMAEALK